MENMGDMFEYARIHSGDFSRFFAMLLASDVAVQLSSGNPAYLAGHSGKDLADMVEGRELAPGDPDLPLGKSRFYWAGWAYAYLLWCTGKSLKYLAAHGLDTERMLSLYSPLHEADLSKLEEVCSGILAESCKGASAMKSARKRSGLTQSGLAAKSGVSLRMIRAYEQGTQDLSRAEYATVCALARVLSCSPDCLTG